MENAIPRRWREWTPVPRGKIGHGCRGQRKVKRAGEDAGAAKGPVHHDVVTWNLGCGYPLMAARILGMPETAAFKVGSAARASSNFWVTLSSISVALRISTG